MPGISKCFLCLQGDNELNLSTFERKKNRMARKCGFAKYVRKTNLGLAVEIIMNIISFARVKSLFVVTIIPFRRRVSFLIYAVLAQSNSLK